MYYKILNIYATNMKILIMVKLPQIRIKTVTKIALLQIDELLVDTQHSKNQACDLSEFF